MEKEEANLETDAAGEVIKSTRMATSNCRRSDDNDDDGGDEFGLGLPYLQGLLGYLGT